MNIRYDEINYSDVMTFMDTVKYGTLSKAAKALDISQPAASKRIAALEKQYGITFFIRKGRGLELTPAGKVFYAEMLKAIDHMETAFNRAYEMQERPVRLFKIGTDGFFDVPILYEMIRCLERENDNVRTEVVDYLPAMTGENVMDLFADHAELLIAPDAWFVPVKDQVKSHKIAAFQFAILVPETHPMFQKEHVTVADLKDVALTVAHTSRESPYLNAIENIFLSHGFRPRIAHVIRRENLCLNILTGGRIAIASSAFFRKENKRTASFYQEKIHVYPIDGAFYPVSFVWRKNNPDPVISKFLAIYDDVQAAEENRQIIARCYGA